jgi:DNA-binding NtrC family response regulator
VLISGETGTGKELVARAIHYLSDRAELPFVAVNCGSFVDTLIDNELFGHERGAYTDAGDRRQGLIAQARRGSLFLDEVDTLTSRGQVALLRVLQEKTFRPLGSTQEEHADIRIIAATNAAVPQLVREGRFRADLYYRLGVFMIHLPPLRERRDDIVTLATHFLAKHARPGRQPAVLSVGARAALMAFDWPGNVRELENVMIRSSHVCRDDIVEPDDLGLVEDACATLPPSVGEIGRFQDRKAETINAFERDYLTRLLRRHRGNVTSAARTAGKDRRDLGKLLKKHGLDPRGFSGSAAVR